MSPAHWASAERAQHFAEYTAAVKLGCISSKTISEDQHTHTHSTREQATKPEVNGQQPAPQPAAAAPAQQAAGEPQGRLPCAEDSFTRQLRQLEPLVAGTQPTQQQQQEQDVSQHGPGSYHPSRADSSDLRYGQAAYSVASYDDNGTDSAASSPRSRSSWAPSVGSHLPPSRGPSASGAGEMMRGKRRPPRATSSGLGREMMREMHLSFTDSVTNTTGSSEASPRRADGQGGGSQVDEREWFRSTSSHLEDNSSQALPRLSGEGEYPGLTSRHLREFSVDGGDGASTFGGSSVTGGAGQHMRSRHSQHLEAHSGKMSLLQLQRAIEKIMVSDGEMYAKLQAGLKGIHSLARETDRLTVARDVTGATCINQYVVVKTLGRGSYGKVKLCLNTLDGHLYAIKMMNRSCLLRTLQRPRASLRKGTRRSLSASSGIGQTAAGSAAAGGAAAAAVAAEESSDVNREIAILKKLDHPNVVKLYEVIDPPGSQYMMLVMEFLEKGPVLQTHDQAGFDCLPEEVAADYFRQAVAGLEYLHFHKVVHGDIKPENLLVSSNGELKISDFGCSRMADGKSSHQRLSGTPAFTAPELVSGNAADPFAADVWALGACLFCFIYGRLPFQGSSVLDVFKAITTAQLELPDDVTISPSLTHLFGRLFDKDPATRITLQEVMCHPWVTDEGRVPLHSCADMGLGLIEVTAQEQLGAIDRASVVSMIRARLKEKAFRSKEYLFQVGQPMNCVYFVMSGVVEITKTATADDVERETSAGASIEHSFTVDIDESLMLDCAMGSMAHEALFPAGAVNGRLHIDRMKARDLRFRQRSCIMEGAEVVVDVKGPGQVVGEVFMQDTPPPCRYSARARGDVLALKLTQENYVRALAAMYYEAENGARAVANSTTASGKPLPGPSASSPGLLGTGMTSSGSRHLGGAAASSGGGSSAMAANVAAAIAAAVSSNTGPGSLLNVGGGISSAPMPVPAAAAARAAAGSAQAAGAAAAAGATAAALPGAEACASSAAAGHPEQPGTSSSSRATAHAAGLSSSTIEDSTLLPSGAHMTSSSGSLPGGGRYPYQKTSSRLAGSSVSGGTAPGEDGSAPLQLLAVGSGEVTDEETGLGA
ncbi:hypothetical protein OEZ86_000488 [Tetradesmus obliquus]|nr:hypothetical protein OEZ86_000488 [Tetradesmus obliquus]